MADERDPQVSKRYRELGAEEPPRALDDAILAASRRAVDSHPAPLVAPAGRRRWYFPVAAAAVITLSVAVTLQVERQRPEERVVADAPQSQRREQVLAQPQKEEQVSQAPAAAGERKAAPKPMRAPQAFTPEPPATPAPPSVTSAPSSTDSLDALAKSRSDNASRDSLAREAAPAPAQGAADARVRAQIQPNAEKRAAQAAETRRMEAELQVKPAPAARAAGAVAAKPAPAPDAAAGFVAPYAVMSSGGPERWLEQIAELRKQGKDEEADKVLAEFRKTYPDYPLTDEMRAKVERKK